MRNDRSAWSFVAFGAEFTSRRLASSRCLRRSSARRAVLRDPPHCRRRRPPSFAAAWNLRRGWILWAGSNYFVPQWGLPLRPWGSPVRVLRDRCPTPDCMANFMAFGPLTSNKVISSMLVALGSASINFEGACLPSCGSQCHISTLRSASINLKARACRPASLIAIRLLKNAARSHARLHRCARALVRRATHADAQCTRCS